MTTWSKEDLVNWGSVCGFYPDTADSWIYNNITNTALTTNLLNTAGTGICNTRNCEYVSMNDFLASFGGQTVTATGGTIPASYNLTTKCTVPNTSVRQTYNAGLQTRQSWINYNPLFATTTTGTLPAFVNVQSSVADASTGSGIVGSFTQQFIPNNQQLINASGVIAGSYTTLFQACILGQDTAQRTIQIPAVLRLKDLCNFFEKVPLLKGSTMRIYLNTNQCQFQAQYIGGQLLQNTAIAGTAGNVNQINYGAISMATAPQMLGGGATNPLMLASHDLGQGGYNVAPLNLADSSAIASGVANNIAPNYALLNIAVSIARTQFSSITTQSTPITQCRLYAPAYTLNPLAETRLLELSPTKKILYDDIFQFYFPNQSANANINILVSNGIPNIKQVIVVPFLTASGATSVNAPPVLNQYGVSVAGANTLIGATPVATSTLLSPFSTAGATPDPIQLGNFQILISGNVLFQQQLQYSFEDFYEQMVSINQLNGSATTGLGSGLIGLKEWSYLYRYYVGNASRILPSEEGMARSVQLQCINLTNVAIDLMVFVVYEKAITVNFLPLSIQKIGKWLLNLF